MRRGGTYRSDVCLSHKSTLLVFFFPAEDGIRYRNVTGVQTCALPIYEVEGRDDLPLRRRVACRGARGGPEGCRGSGRRSEERRVGKECRSRWSPYDQRKQRNWTRRLSGESVERDRW